MGRYGAIWGDMGRYGAIWGDMGRYGAGYEWCGAVGVGGRRGRRAKGRGTPVAYPPRPPACAARLRENVFEASPMVFPESVFSEAAFLRALGRSLALRLDSSRTLPGHLPDTSRLAFSRCVFVPPGGRQGEPARPALLPLVELCNHAASPRLGAEPTRDSVLWRYGTRQPCRLAEAWS